MPRFRNYLAKIAKRKMQERMDLGNNSRTLLKINDG